MLSINRGLFKILGMNYYKNLKFYKNYKSDCKASINSLFFKVSHLLKYNPIIVKINSDSNGRHQNTVNKITAMSEVLSNSEVSRSSVDDVTVSEVDEVESANEEDSELSSGCETSKLESGDEVDGVSTTAGKSFVLKLAPGITSVGDVSSSTISSSTSNPEIISGSELKSNIQTSSSDNDLNESFSEESVKSIKQEVDDDEISGSFHCELCSEEFQLEDELQSHRDKAHNMSEINYDNFDIYIEHTTGSLPYRCRLCGKGFTRKQTAKHHHVVHTGETPYACLVCQKAFRHRSALYKHKRSHSEGEPLKYPCEVCGKSFKHKSYLSIHAVIHTEDRPYICDICGSTFKDRSARNKHLHAHSGVKPYSCEVCGKCFGRKGDYKSHLVIHTDNRPYVCSVCGRSFRSNSNCRRHARIHTNSYPYECDVCGKAFNQNWKLKEHKYIHSDEAPFVCEICSAAFRYSRKLKKHMEKHIQEGFCSNEPVDGEDSCVFEIIDVQPDISAFME